MNRIGVLLSLCLLLGGCGETIPPDTTLPEAAVRTDSPTVTDPPLSAETAPETTAPPPEDPPVIPEEPIPLPETVETNLLPSEARELMAQLAALAEEYKLSISYLSGDGSYYCHIDGRQLYPSASTIKAAYCQYLLASGVDFEQELLFETSLKRTSASGMLTEDKKGTLFTVRELVGYTLRSSDNMAYRLLFNAFGRKGYNAWVEALGLPGLTFPDAYEFTDVCAADLSAVMLEIYRSSQTDSTLTEFLLESDYNVQINSGTKYYTASKYGFEGGTMGYHDTAIVYAPHPYILTVMSHIYPEAPGAEEPFAQAAALADRLNAVLFAEKGSSVQKNAPLQ